MEVLLLLAILGVAITTLGFVLILMFAKNFDKCTDWIIEKTDKFFDKFF